jgi:hypothetical protein
MRKPIPDPGHFWKIYSLLNDSASLPNLDNQEKTFCRFCKRDASATSMTEITHLLPELLGKNQIHTYEECNECNHVFSDYESHLSNFVRPFITILGISGKRGVPAFRSRSINSKPDSVTELVYAACGKRKLFVGEESDVTIDWENNTMSLLFRQPPYVPVKIYKALVKIGMSLLPRHFDPDCQHIYRWLLSKDNDIDYVAGGFITTLTGAYWAAPSAELYQANHLHTKEEEYPEYTLILRFANQVLQIFLPFTDVMRREHKKDKRTLCVNLLPPMPYLNIERVQRSYQIMAVSFSQDYSIKADRNIHFTFGEIEMMQPATTDEIIK